MRKAGLLDQKPLTATPGMLAAAQKDRGTVKYAVYTYSSNRKYIEYETRYYFRAAPSALEGILEVDLFTRKDLAEGKKDPAVRIFMDYEKEDFASWNTSDKKWSSAKIDMLDTGDKRYTYSYRGKNYVTKAALKLVNRCLGTGNMADVETAVLCFQEKVRGAELKKKHRLITDMIDGYMDAVPDRLPADWMRFIRKRAFEGMHFIFYDKKSGKGYCTCCMLHVRVSVSVRHNMSGKCTCGSRITYKSWNKQKHITEKMTVSLIQKCTDGQNFIYRQFRAVMSAERKKGYVPEITFFENYRKIFAVTDRKGPLKEINSYEWGFFKNTGIERWCEEGRVHYAYSYYGCSSCFAKSMLYTANLKRVLKGTKLQYVPAADIIKGITERINVIAVLGDMGMSFPYEAFWKMGLKRFVRERAVRSGTEGAAHIEQDARKPWQYLKLTKEDMMQAVRLDATDRQMRIIQRAAELDVKLTDEQIIWLDENVGVSVLMKYFPLHTPYRIIRYIKETVLVADNESAGNEKLHFWTDYLDTAEQLGWNMGSRAVFFPQAIRRAHDEAAAVFAIQKDKNEAAEMKRKDLIMHGHAREIKKAFCYRNRKYMIKVPGRWLDFKKEGQMQHNCVATYYEKALKGGCIILFIRKRKEPEKPFCTVEIQNDGGRFRIVQNRTEYNKDAPQEAKAFMEEAVKAAQKIADRILKQETTEIRIQTAV